MNQFFISASVMAADEAQAARAVETLARAGTGLALEGMTLSLTIGPYEDDHEGDDE